MSVPGTDKAAVRQVIRALVAGGWTLDMVYDGEEEIPTTTESQVMDAVFAVDMAHLHVHKNDLHGWVWFVLGNDPDEVVADYTINLEKVMGPLWEHWNDPESE